MSKDIFVLVSSDGSSSNPSTPPTTPDMNQASQHASDAMNKQQPATAVATTDKRAKMVQLWTNIVACLSIIMASITNYATRVSVKAKPFKRHLTWKLPALLICIVLLAFAATPVQQTPETTLTVPRLTPSSIENTEPIDHNKIIDETRLALHQSWIDAFSFAHKLRSENDDTLNAHELKNMLHDYQEQLWNSVVLLETSVVTEIKALKLSIQRTLKQPIDNTTIWELVRGPIIKAQIVREFETFTKCHEPVMKTLFEKADALRTSVMSIQTARSKLRNVLLDLRIACQKNLTSVTDNIKPCGNINFEELEGYTKLDAEAVTRAYHIAWNTGFEYRNVLIKYLDQVGIFNHRRKAGRSFDVQLMYMDKILCDFEQDMEDQKQRLEAQLKGQRLGWTRGNEKWIL